MIPIPCPHFKISIVKRSQGQSAVAGAAYQSGERLFSEYDQKTKFYNKKKELVHAEIMLPTHAPPGYADRATLWNSVEAVENQWNSQLARRIVLALPREVPKDQYLPMLKEFCNEQFVSKGMVADFAIHDKGDGNPHAHILLTIRAMDEHGKWLPKARKVYDLDENGERIQLPSGNWKCHKENTVDWNDQKYAEVWRHGWETITNRYLEAAGRPERVDLRSFERQGVQQIPTVHLGPTAHQMEKRGIETFLGNLNRDIRAANSLMQSIRSTIRGLQRWIADLTEKKQLLLDALEKAKEPTLSDLLVDYFNLRNEQRSGWSGKALCAGDPRIKERMDLDVEVSRLKLMKADHQSKQYRLEDQLLKYFPEEIEKHKGFIKGFESDLEVLAAHPHPEDGFAGMEIRGDLLTDKENAGAALLDACKEVKTSDPVQIGSYRGYAISVEFSAWKQEYTLLLKGQMTHRATLGTDPRGNLTRIDNALAQMPQRLEAAKAQLDNLYQQQAAAKEEVGKPFLYEEELRSKNARLVELDTLLNIDGKGQAHTESVVAKSTRPSVLDNLKRPVQPRSTDKKPKQHEEVR